MPQIATLPIGAEFTKHKMRFMLVHKGPNWARVERISGGDWDEYLDSSFDHWYGGIGSTMPVDLDEEVET